MRKFSELLPVGSVVKLGKSEKSLLIIGFAQKNVSTGKIFDYIGVFYPEGYIGGKFQYLFMHEDIKSVEYTGMKNTEYFSMIEKLENNEKA